MQLKSYSTHFVEAIKAWTESSSAEVDIIEKVNPLFVLSGILSFTFMWMTATV